MASYAISFRIAEVGNADERRASVVKVVEALSTCVTWDETTSFILIQTARTAAEISLEVYLRSGFNKDVDKLLVIRVDGDEYATYGKIDFPATLAGFFREQGAVAANALAALIPKRR
jgi:hypothetical protein